MFRARSFCLASLAAAALSASAMGQLNPTYFERGIPQECADKMAADAKNGERFVCLAFPHEGGNRWSLVTDKGFMNRGIPQECHDEMNKLHKAGHKILCVAFPPAGGNRFSIITDKTFFNRNIPQECHDKMVEYTKAGHKLVWVAFPPAGGNSWSLVTDKTFFNRNIPQECHAKMGEMKAAGEKIECVAFPAAGGNRWSIISDKSFFNRGVPDECHEVMRAMAHLPEPLHLAAFHPAGGFAVVSDAGPAGLAEPALVVNGKQFSLDKFAAALKADMDAFGVKYAFVVRHGNAVRAWAHGPKRTAATAPAEDFTIFDRFNPASVTKTVTAVAVMQLMEKKNLGPDAKIWHFLPTSWNIPDSVKTISFKELLNHTSGFRGGGLDYDGLKTMVEAGIKMSDKTYKYENVNFALSRILVADMNGYNPAGQSDQGVATAKNFREYCQKHIFDVCSIPDVQWKAVGTDPTLFFPDPPGASQGTTYGDWTDIPGSAGVHLSIAELSHFLHVLASSNALLSQSMRHNMDAYGMGWDQFGTNAGDHCAKGGYFPGGNYNGGAELHSWNVKWNNGVELTVVVNGAKSADWGKHYDNAWVTPGSPQPPPAPKAPQQAGGNKPAKAVASRM